uniref:Uncharacterized protein n=1 Tax=Pinctada fucata TaxID=50426 RepID=A0A194APM3_PINFU
MVISYKTVVLWLLVGVSLSLQCAYDNVHQDMKRQISASLDRNRRSPTSDLIAFSYMMSKVKTLVVRGLTLFEELHNQTKAEMDTTLRRASNFDLFTKMLISDLEKYGQRRTKLEDDLLLEVTPLVSFALPGVKVGSLKGLWNAFLGSNVQLDLRNYIQSINGTKIHRTDVIDNIKTRLDKELADVQERLFFVESILENQQYEMRMAFKPDPRVVGVPSGLLGSTTSAS